MAAQAHTTVAPCAQTPANDNPPGKRIDRWRLLIDAMKVYHPPLAVHIAQKKLAGWSFEKVTSVLLEAFDYLDAQEASR